MKQLLRIAILGISGALIVSCGSALNKDLDDARFALDAGNYSSAVTSATAATAADSSNLNGYNLLSAAYSGQAGVNLLSLAQVLTDSGNSSTIFSAMHTELVTDLTHTGTDYAVGLLNLRAAISTLAIGTTTYTGAPTTYAGNTTSGNAVLNNQYFFQVGILMYVEALGLPTIRAQPGTTAGGIAVDASKITAADTTIVQNDFINGYGALVNTATGIPTDNALATTLSKNYCVLKNESVTSGTALTGISQACLQDLTLCQLNGSTYAGPFNGCVAACATFNFAACTGTVAPAL